MPRHGMQVVPARHGGSQVSLTPPPHSPSWSISIIACLSSQAFE